MLYYVRLTTADPADPDRLQIIRVAGTRVDGLVPYSAPLDQRLEFDLAHAVARATLLATQHAGPLFREVSIVRVRPGEERVI